MVGCFSFSVCKSITPFRKITVEVLIVPVCLQTIRVYNLLKLPIELLLHLLSLPLRSWFPYSSISLRMIFPSHTSNSWVPTNMEFGLLPKVLHSWTVSHHFILSSQIPIDIFRFIAVLATQKPKATQSFKNSKEREIEIWENELRESLARKRPATATLSKSDKALFDKQLAKEAGIRQEMREALGRLRRGFALLLCLVDSGVEAVQEHLAQMINDVLAVIVTRPVTLIAPEAFATYLVRLLSILPHRFSCIY
jgi:hypothetical protein